MRGSGTYILPMIHPATFFRNQVGAFQGIEGWRKAVRVQREGPTLIHPLIEEWQWRPSIDNVRSYFNNMLWEGDGRKIVWGCAAPGPWAIDFEATLNREVVCLGIWSCHEPTKHRGICIPLLCQGGRRYWSPQDEVAVMDMVRDFFLDPRRAKVGQNANGYDLGYPPFNARALIKTAWGIDVQGFIGDTMAAHHTCFSELKHSLAFQASIATDMGPYKEELWQEPADEEEDDEDDWTRILELPDERVRVYNLKDAFATALIWNGLVMEMT